MQCHILFFVSCALLLPSTLHIRPNLFFACISPTHIPSRAILFFTGILCLLIIHVQTYFCSLQIQLIEVLLTPRIRVIFCHT